jgi:hypothetical protein
MAKKPDHLAGSFETENTGGLLTGFLAEEDVFDRRALWRLGSWGAGSVGAVVVAVLANQSAIGWRHDQVAAADLTRQSQQIQSVARESQNETRRLASAIDTLNSDRDRLYSRVTVLEQGLDSVTGAIARQSSAPAATQAVAAAVAAGGSREGRAADAAAKSGARSGRIAGRHDRREDNRSKSIRSKNTRSKSIRKTTDGHHRPGARDRRTGGAGCTDSAGGNTRGAAGHATDGI